jgi:hypothetical protein
MSSNAIPDNWDELEAAAEKAGGYLAQPSRPVVMDYDYRAMSKYAAEKGMTSMELTDQERDMFKFDPPLVYS